MVDTTGTRPESITPSRNDDVIRAISLFVEIIANAVLDADKEVGIEIIETLPQAEGEKPEAEACQEVVFGSDDEEPDYTTFVFDPTVEKKDEEEQAPPVKAVKVTAGGIEVDEEILYKD